MWKSLSEQPWVVLENVLCANSWKLCPWKGDVHGKCPDYRGQRCSYLFHWSTKSPMTRHVLITAIRPSWTPRLVLLISFQFCLSSFSIFPPLLTFGTRTQAQGLVRGLRYPIWFNSMFEFCQKMIHSIFDSILLYPRFNSKYYSIQKICWFNSKDNSIQ